MQYVDVVVVVCVSGRGSAVFGQAVSEMRVERIVGAGGVKDMLWVLYRKRDRSEVVAGTEVVTKIGVSRWIVKL